MIITKLAVTEVESDVLCSVGNRWGKELAECGASVWPNPLWKFTGVSGFDHPLYHVSIEMFSLPPSSNRPIFPVVHDFIWPRSGQQNAEPKRQLQDGHPRHRGAKDFGSCGTTRPKARWKSGFWPRKCRVLDGDGEMRPHLGKMMAVIRKRQQIIVTLLFLWIMMNCQ